MFLADTYGGYDTYRNSLDDCIRRAAQWPMTDPTATPTALPESDSALSKAFDPQGICNPGVLLPG